MNKLKIYSPAAAGLAVMCGAASATPVFRTVVIDDFPDYERSGRWVAQIGSGGHVAYLTIDDAQVRLWDGTTTEVLHRVGTHLEGLAPGVITNMLPPNTQGGFRTGSILGVDREGGVSVALYAGPDPSIWTILLASTVPGGGFRAIMAPPEFAAETGVVRKNLAMPFIGLRRCNMGYTRAIGFDAVIDQSYSIFSPDLTRRVIWRRDEPVPGGTAYTGLTFLVTSSDFGIARNSDHAGIEAADLVPFLSFSTQTIEHGVMRTRGTSAEMLLRSGSPINDLRMINRARPLVSANSAGQTLVAIDRVLDTALGTEIYEPLLLYSESGEPQLLLQRDDIIPFVNFEPRPYNPPRSDWIFRRMILGEDGSVTFDISPESREIARRSPSGEYTMLIAPDAELLGVPGATIGSDGRVAKVTLSLDGTSAGSIYRINGTDTVVYAGPSGVTRILGVGDEVEVTPGVFRTAGSVLLHDVNAEHVLVSMSYGGGRAMLAVTVPACRPDLNNDGVVDADDFFLFLQFFAAGDPRADINGDGVIDADDFFEYLNLFAQGC